MGERGLKFILGSVLCMNTVDAILSLIYIKHLSILEEANPFAGFLMSLGDIPFVIAKTGIVSFGVYVLWKNRKKQIAKVGSIVAFSTYLMLMIGFLLFLL